MSMSTSMSMLMLMLSSKQHEQLQLRVPLGELMHACPMQFVLHHAPGVRRLRFIRKLPLLKGLSDQAIIKVGERVTEEVFEVQSAPPHLQHAPCPTWQLAAVPISLTDAVCCRCSLVMCHAIRPSVPCMGCNQYACIGQLIAAKVSKDKTRCCSKQENVRTLNRHWGNAQQAEATGKPRWHL